MVDIHCHIISNIDDGADTLDEAYTMIYTAAKCGTTVMAATPHYFNASQCLTESSRGMVTEKFEQLKSFCLKKNVPVTLCLGSEQFGITDIMSLYSEKQLITLNNSHYLLIEFAFDDNPERVRYCLSKVKSMGLTPVIAHPERYVFLQENPYLVYSLCDDGCLFQLNKGSPLGRYGRHAAAFSTWMLDNRLAHVVASDCHSPYIRTPDMSKTQAFLYSNYPDDYARALLEDNPMKILRDEKTI